MANRGFLCMAGCTLVDTVVSSFRTLLTSAGAIYFDTQILPLLHLANRRNEIALDIKVGSARIPMFATFALSTKPDSPATEIKVVLVEATERRSFEGSFSNHDAKPNSSLKSSTIPRMAP